MHITTSSNTSYKYLTRKRKKKHTDRISYANKGTNHLHTIETQYSMYPCQRFLSLAELRPKRETIRSRVGPARQAVGPTPE